jgi:hypothetical protein
MPLNSTQKARVQSHLASKKILPICPVCDAKGKWAYKELVFHPACVGGVPQHAGLTSALIECDNCGFRLLLSAEKLGLV